MKTPKIIRYRLGVSRTFPTTHKRKGEKTYFVYQICNALDIFSYTAFCDDKGDIIVNIKIHTIRSNYDLWAKRMEKVHAGLAVIELFYWEGKPYNSKQIVFATLGKDSGCGVQELSFINNEFNRPCVFGEGYAIRNSTNELSKNDGLSLDDFKDWFKKYDLSKPMAIIHFTSYRY